MGIETWRTHTDTLTEDEVLNYFIHDGEILLMSSMSEHTVYLSRQQALNLMCGLATLLGKLDT